MFIKYFERGYVPIPVFSNGKNPTIKEWSKYCFEKPTLEQVEIWDDNHKGNIGITCGAASGIVVIDIDTDDKALLSIAPQSNVSRRGAKGEARVFKYNKAIKSLSCPGLDILSEGRQFLVPPSIHPDTKKPYIWLTPDTLENVDSSDLPELTDLSFFETFKRATLGQQKEFKPGRNNKLVDIVCAMRGRGEPEGKIIKEIYDWDSQYHKPRLFTDSNERFKATNERDAFNNAAIFFSRVSTSLFEKGLVQIEEDRIIVTSDQEQEIKNKFEKKVFPEPTGLIKDIRDAIVDLSELYMPNIALGGALGVMAGITSNRFRFNQCWTNMYLMLLAPSGGGKSFPQRVMRLLLDEYLDTNLLGYGTPQSSSAFIKNLVSRRERVDVVDEASTVFTQMNSGGTWQTTILETMCGLWSASNTKFSAAEYADTDKVDTSSCYNPCVSFVGASTIEGLKPHISRLTVSKGLLPRFLIFSDDNYGDENQNDFLNEPLLQRCVAQIKEILKNERIRSNPGDTKPNNDRYNPKNIAPTDLDAVNYFKNLKSDFITRLKTEDSPPLREFITRGKEHIMKLATVHAIGNGRNIAINDLQWAKETWEVCLHNSTPFIRETAVDTGYERDKSQILNLVRSNASGVTMSVITNKIPRLNKKQIEIALDNLMESGQIIKASSKYNKIIFLAK